MSSHILRFHESVDKAYARPSDAFADLRRIAREVPQDQREEILDHLFDTGMRERRPFLSFNDRRVGVFIGTPWCIWEAWDAPEKHTTFFSTGPMFNFKAWQPIWFAVSEKRFPR